MASRVISRPMQPKPQKPPKKARKRLRFETPKRAKERFIYNEAREEYLGEHPICEWENIGIDTENGLEYPIPCIHPSTNIHHAAGREGKLLYDKRWFKACCDKHGGPYPHDNSDISYRTGFMVLRHRITSK